MAQDYFAAETNIGTEKDLALLTHKSSQLSVLLLTIDFISPVAHFIFW